MRVSKYVRIALIALFVAFCISILIHHHTDGYKNQYPLYERLMNDFQEIFPDNNRNSGGSQFYKHIFDYDASFEDFMKYHTYYCAVSGSPISPDRKDAKTPIIIKDIEGNDIYGIQYRCCSPCVCDITKHARVERHAYKGNPIYVFVIRDPCQKSHKIPEEVSSFECKHNQTLNGKFTETGHLIIGVLHEATPYTGTPMQKASLDDQNTLCKERNETPIDEIVGGMGDIFISLANVVPFSEFILD